MTQIILRDEVSNFSITYDSCAIHARGSIDYNLQILEDAQKKGEITDKTKENLTNKLRTISHQRASTAYNGDFLDDFLGTV